MGVTDSKAASEAGNTAGAVARAQGSPPAEVEREAHDAVLKEGGSQDDAEKVAARAQQQAAKALLSQTRPALDAELEEMVAIKLKNQLSIVQCMQKSLGKQKKIMR